MVLKNRPRAKLDLSSVHGFYWSWTFLLGQTGTRFPVELAS